MKCPVCQQPDLVMSERQNIEIDYCPNCRGVWLDRGELDKIIERANQYEAEEMARRQAPPQQAPPQQAPPQQAYPPQSYDSGHRHDDSRKYHKKRKPFWAELFD